MCVMRHICYTVDAETTVVSYDIIYHKILLVLEHGFRCMAMVLMRELIT